MTSTALRTLRRWLTLPADERWPVLRRALRDSSVAAAAVFSAQSDAVRALLDDFDFGRVWSDGYVLGWIAGHEDVLSSVGKSLAYGLAVAVLSSLTRVLGSSPKEYVAKKKAAAEYKRAAEEPDALYE